MPTGIAFGLFGHKPCYNWARVRHGRTAAAVERDASTFKERGLSWRASDRRSPTPHNERPLPQTASGEAPGALPRPRRVRDRASPRASDGRPRPGSLSRRISPSCAPAPPRTGTPRTGGTRRNAPAPPATAWSRRPRNRGTGRHRDSRRPTRLLPMEGGHRAAGARRGTGLDLHSRPAGRFDRQDLDRHASRHELARTLQHAGVEQRAPQG